MRNARDALDAPHRLLAGGITHARGEDDSGERGQTEGGDERDVQRLGQKRPDAQQRDEKEQPGEAEEQPQPGP